MKTIDNIMTEVKNKFPELKPSKHLLIVDIYMQAFKDGFREASETALESITSIYEEGEGKQYEDDLEWLKPSFQPTSVTHHTNREA